LFVRFSDNREDAGVLGPSSGGNETWVWSRLSRRRAYRACGVRSREELSVLPDLPVY
jgi:hypothetical protein